MEIEIREKGLRLTKPDEVANIFRSVLATECEMDQDKEHFWVVGVNQNNRVKYIELVSLGTLNTSLVHPREIFRFAILKAAACVILCHNHPSGNSTPSEEDTRITKQLCDAGRILGIKVLDHVIVGNESRSSFQEMGLI